MSFGWLGIFRKGSWRALRSFSLKERRDVSKRLAVIRAELRRIGSITVLYNQEVDATGDIRVTEERKGFVVSRNSSLERLVQAYVAQGGNPLDISHFFVPDRTVVVSTDSQGRVTTGEEYPFGGVAFPKTSEPNEPEGSFGSYPGGFIPLRKYVPGRIGGRKDLDSDAEPFVNFMTYLRRPISQEIRRKRQDIEARIIKLCDLREQFLYEREVLLAQAFGGLSLADTDFDPNRYAQALRVPQVTQTLDEIFFVVDTEGIVDFNQTNVAELAKYDNLFEDILPDEANTAL